MSNKQSFKQLAKRILALTLAVMLMNSTIAYLTPSEVVLAGETTDTITRVTEEPTNPDEQDYDGYPFVLSTVNGEDFTWTGSGEATIVYYTDSECNTQTGVSDAVGSGATSDGGAPVNVGTYLHLLTISQRLL